MPPAKMFPISTGAPPASMTFPNIQSAAPVAANPVAAGDATTPVSAGAPVEADDGFTPEERRKN